MKNYKIIFFLIISFFFCFTSVNGQTIKKIKVDYNNLMLRKGPGTNYEAIKSLAMNAEYPLVEEGKIPNQAGCGDGWYKINYSYGKEGYVCSTYALVVEREIIDYETQNECEADLKIKGFPQSYVGGLCALKQEHPNWSFESDITGLDFPTSIAKESVVGKSLISVFEPGYLSLDVGSYDFLTDTFTVKEGSNWFAANSDVVGYYLDPRNFFDERYIFMFEKLSYDASYQTKESVEAVLKGRDIARESETILNASVENNINAIYLASKIRQETGGNYTNYSLSGRSVTYNGVTYPHVYNPYNIGAATGAQDGIVWAVAGTSYLRPWTVLTTAIRGGAQFISSTYIGRGQNTIYYQKFNTSSYSVYAPYAHEYMTNVRGAASEASIAHDGYARMELLDDTPFVFLIPVYNNMNDKYELPKTGNPNNHLSDLKINDRTIMNFEHDNDNYTYYVSSTTIAVKIDATPINKNATISGLGIINVPNEENDLKVIVKAQNESEKIYTIKVIKVKASSIVVDDIVSSLPYAKSDGYFILGIGYKLEDMNTEVQKIAGSALVSRGDDTQGILKTGDIVKIKTENDEKEFTIVIKGDATGDGNINIQDLLRIQKCILGYIELNGSYSKAADTNQDGQVTILDLLRIQKHILGYLTIN